MGQTLDVHWGQIQPETKKGRIPGEFMGLPELMVTLRRTVSSGGEGEGEGGGWGQGRTR